jgi:hypothetical protein
MIQMSLRNPLKLHILDGSISSGTKNSRNWTKINWLAKHENQELRIVCWDFALAKKETRLDNPENYRGTLEAI